MTSIVKRAKRRTPKFFKKLRTIGLSVSAVGTSILALPVNLPFVTTAAGYLVVAGLLTSGISQVAVTNEKQ